MLIFFLATIILGIWTSRAEDRDLGVSIIQSARVIMGAWLVWHVGGLTWSWYKTGINPVEAYKRESEPPLLINGLAVYHNNLVISTRRELKFLTDKYQVVLQKTDNCPTCRPYYFVVLEPLQEGMPNPIIR